MLILAGVSINAIIGENGLLTKSQYVTFLSEMAAIEEAVQMWKAGEAIEAGGQTTAIPTNGMCKPSDVTSTERLTGEVGYYRVWGMSGTQPVMNILSGASEFNSAYSGELVTYPAGVQDLYYLNNEACGIDSKKTYLIDAATGMVYSMTGINLKGVACYSSNMAKAVMNGDATAPNFAEAEVSGSGSGEKLAGNVQEEFLPDGTKNPAYNPNGFQIIASSNANNVLSLNNIFKLYNNGDLYGKGIKGTQLNTPVEEMEKINSNVWKEWKVPQEVGEYKKIVIGVSDAMYFIDKNDDLWVYGNNNRNKFGLTEKQQIEYTGREAMKVDLNGKKVRQIFIGTNCTFLITTDNKVLVAGENSDFQLGLGDNREIIQFEEIQVKNVENIEKIYCSEGESLVNIIKYKDNTFYLAGNDARGILGTVKQYKTFEKVFDGNNGPDIDEEIKDFSWTCQCILLKNNGSLWVSGYTGYVSGGLSSEKDGSFTKYEISDIAKIYPNHVSGALLVTNNGEYYALGVSEAFGTNYSLDKKPNKINVPNDLKFKEIFNCYNACFFLTEDGKLYGSGEKRYLGLNDNSGYTEDLIKLDFDGIDTLYNSEILLGYNNVHSMILLLKDGKYYTTGKLELMFGNDILQKNWTLVAQNVKYFNGSGSCYVDKENNLWISGNARYCGLGEQSKLDKNIDNYVKCTDPNIMGKVEQCYSGEAVTYVLLNNKELWATGLYINKSNMRNQYPGWEGIEDKTTFVKVLDNVLFFDCNNSGGYQTRVALTATGEAYGWGESYAGVNGIPGNTKNELPKTLELPIDLDGTENVLKLRAFARMRNSIISKAGKVFYTGKHSGAWDGGHPSTDFFSEYTYNFTLNKGEKIIDLASSSVTSAMFLTSDGRIFGYGPEDTLGIGKTSTKKVENSLIEGLKGRKIIQITAGKGFYIVVDEDGKVYGTGSNQYGILGRWKGAPREAGRYRTAFEWVECPELEI